MFKMMFKMKCKKSFIYYHLLSFVIDVQDVQDGFNFLYI